MKWPRHARLFASVAERNESGKPPRRQNVSAVHAAGQTLRRLTQQVAGRAAEHEGSGAMLAPVDQNAQDGEQVGASLDFVDDHEPLERSQRRHRFVESGERDRILEIEVVQRVLGQKLPRECRLAALSWPCEHDHLAPAQHLAHFGEQRFTNYHDEEHREKRSKYAGISWWFLAAEHGVGPSSPRSASSSQTVSCQRTSGLELRLMRS
jgi:hypothetical protein